MGGQRLAEHFKGKDTNALGFSDNPDSGSDAQGAYGTGKMNSESDAKGTGERAPAGTRLEACDADIMPDPIEGPSADPAFGNDADFGHTAARAIDSLVADEDDGIEIVEGLEGVDDAKGDNDAKNDRL